MVVCVQRGMTALHHAAMKGELEILQMLIEAGCELNTQDKVSDVQVMIATINK